MIIIAAALTGLFLFSTIKIFNDHMPASHWSCRTVYEDDGRGQYI